jgi:predicted DNA binding CopG/RHH family protein
MPDIVYKQASITIQTAKNIETIKDEFAKRGIPMQAPAILGKAVNELLAKLESNG